MERLLATPKTIPVLPSSRPIRTTSGTHDTASRGASEARRFERGLHPRNRSKGEVSEGERSQPPTSEQTACRTLREKTRDQRTSHGSSARTSEWGSAPLPKH